LPKKPPAPTLSWRKSGNWLDQIRREVTRPWVLMEICGGQTHAILRSGLDQLLPAEVELVHGPGCPVCVTPVSKLDRTHAWPKWRGVGRIPASGCRLREEFARFDAEKLFAMQTGKPSLRPSPAA